MDAVIAAYKKDVDRTLLRKNLALTPTQRIQQLQEMVRLAHEMRRAVRESQKTASQEGT